MGRYLIKKSQIVAIMVFLIEILGTLALAQTNITESVLERIGWVAILYCILSVSVLYYIRREWDIFLIFMVMCYLFSFGQCILAAFGYKLGIFAFSMARGFFSNKEILDAGAFSFFSIALTGIGFCLYRKTNIGGKTASRPVPTSNNLCKIAWVLLIVSAVPTFYELYKDMTTVFSVGYGNTLGNATGIDKIFVLISGFYISAVLILYCFEEKKRYIVYLALGLYAIMQLLGGSRISVFRLAIVLLIISNLLRKEINKKRLVWIFLFGLIGVFAFSFVSSARNYIYLADDIQLFFKKTAGDLWENNFIISAIKEMGNTQVINTLVYSLCPSKVEYRYGLSFVRSIYSIFPNVFNLKYISIDEIFSGFYTVTNAGCGASFIAEGYWNFGYFSAFFFLALGYIWAVLADRFKRICNEEYVNPEKAFLIVYLMYFMIFLVRSESIELGRSFVYYALVPVLMSKTLHSNRGGVRQAKEQIALILSSLKYEFQKAHGALQYCYFSEREVAML